MEQNSPEDNFCLEIYCNHYNSQIYKRQTIRAGMIKLIADLDGRTTCPYFNNIKLIAYHHLQAQGPIYARSLIRKVLGNEKYCMQIDSHTKFIKNWDNVIINEWKNTYNEFGIITSVPPSMLNIEKYSLDSDDLQFTVPRQCSIKFRENGFPVSFISK